MRANRNNKADCVKPLDLVRWSACFLWLGLLFACEPKSNSIQFFALDTPCNISLQGYVNDSLLLAIEQEVLRIEAAMSSYIDSSEIGTLNRKGQNILTAETFALVERALEYAEQSDGRFNPAIGPLSHLWDITGSRQQAIKSSTADKNRDAPNAKAENASTKNNSSKNNQGTIAPKLGDSAERRPPSQAAILAVLPSVAYSNVQLNKANRQVTFDRPGMKLDLGSIAKGYAADQIAQMLQNAAAPAGVIDLGGNILLYGHKDGGEPWSVGVRGEGSSYLLGMFLFQPKAVVTSGVYQRYYMYEGKRYHHILGKNGYPVDNGLFSVTVIAQSSTAADALSTMLFIYGVEKGLQEVARRQKNGEGIEALFVTEQKQVYGSLGFARLSEQQYNDLEAGQISSKELPAQKIWLFSLQPSLKFANM